MNLGRRSGGRRRSALSDINVTPLVDVMLVLLIIFMVTAPALLQELEVNIPRSTVGQAEAEEGVVVTLKDNVVLIDREQVALKDFEARFAAARARIGDRALFLRTDEGVPYGRVIEIVGKIKAAGIDKLGLVVEVVPSAKTR